MDAQTTIEIQVTEIREMHLWRDAPGPLQFQLSCSVAELEARILALPSTMEADMRVYKPLLAEFSMPGELARPLRIYMVVVSGTAESKVSTNASVHTGAGEGDWVCPGATFRLVGFDTVEQP